MSVTQRYFYFKKLGETRNVTQYVTVGAYTNIRNKGDGSYAGILNDKYLKTANHPKEWDAKLRGLNGNAWQPGRQYFNP